MKVIGFCGLPGSGKTTAINAIKDLGYVITMGDVIRSELMKRKIEFTDENLGFIAKDLRKQEGNKIIALKCLELIDELNRNDTIFIDGLRSMEEVEVFRQRWKFPIIAIVAPQEIRYKRIAKRARSDDSDDFSEIKNREMREIRFGLNEVIRNADIQINNQGSIEELKTKTRERVVELLNAY